MRRQKCDRNLPCSRCIKRGEADRCTREWPEGGYDPRVHRTYPRHDEKDEDGHSQTSPTSGTESPSLHPSLRTPSTVGHDRPTPNGLYSAPFNTKATVEKSDVINFLGWGHSKLAEFDLPAVELVNDVCGVRNATTGEPDASNGFGTIHEAQLGVLQMLLPNPQQVFDIVKYHMKYIAWYHGCLHGPTFLQELKDVCDSPDGLVIRNMDARWAALLFSVLAATMACAQESEKLAWNFSKAEQNKLTRHWYKASITCLNIADYMWRHHLHSVQAMTVLTLSAHVLGFGNTQSTLLGTALKIAQGLGLQRLPIDDDERNITSGQGVVLMPGQYQKIAQREAGRRVWAQLCIQDWFSVPFSEMYSIQKLHFTTAIPSCIDEMTLRTIPWDRPSKTTFARVLLKMADVLPAMHDAVLNAQTPITKYEAVLEYDAKMRKIVAEEVPPCFNKLEPIDQEWPQFILWGRRSVEICLHHKIIMIHRQFLGRSFTDSSYAFSRKTCIDSSKVILREVKQARDDEGPSFWIDQAFMVAAGITLALDIFHRKADEPELAEHRRLVETTVNMLSQFDSSMIAFRGVRLLTSLLAEHARISATSTMESYRKHGLDEATDPPQKRQKFDVPLFLEKFVGNDSFTQSLAKSALQTPDVVTPTVQTEPDVQPAPNATAGDDLSFSPPAYEQFEQLFPPEGGISNNFLFEDLLNFDFVQ